ncbi:hypothetical protein FQZ97_879360 [compost metagenome]
MELRQQPAAHQDHHRAQHDGAHDADHQHPLLVRRGHGEVAEDQQEDKDVVHRQALLYQIAGQELQRLFIRQRGRARAVFHRPPEQAVEQKAQAHPDQRPVDRFLDAHGVGALLLEHDEIDEQRRQHEADEHQPEPQGRDGFHG